MEGHQQAVVSYDKSRILGTAARYAHAHLHDDLIHEFGHAFEGVLTPVVTQLHRGSRSQRKAALDAGIAVAKFNFIPIDIERARLEGNAELLTSLLEKNFTNGIYKQEYAVNQLTKALVQALEMNGGGTNSSPDVLKTLLSAHFQDDKPAVAEVLQALGSVAKDPRYKNYRFMPGYDIDHSFPTSKRSPAEIAVYLAMAVGALALVGGRYVEQQASAKVKRRIDSTSDPRANTMAEYLAVEPLASNRQLAAAMEISTHEVERTWQRLATANFKRDASAPEWSVLRRSIGPGVALMLKSELARGNRRAARDS